MTAVVDRPSEREAEIARTWGTKIGFGAFRDVYRRPESRWVYKFDATGGDANRREAENYRRIQQYLGDLFDVPEMVLLDNGVLAAEFVEGKLGVEVHPYDAPECPCLSHGIPDCWRKLITRIPNKFDDLHGRNVKIVDKKIVIIDIGGTGANTSSEACPFSCCVQYS